MLAGRGMELLDSDEEWGRQGEPTTRLVAMTARQQSVVASALHGLRCSQALLRLSSGAFWKQRRGMTCGEPGA